MSVLSSLVVTGRARVRGTLLAATALSLTGVLTLSGCGSEPDSDEAATTTSGSSGSGGAAATDGDPGDSEGAGDTAGDSGGSREAEPLTVDNLADRCELLASVAGGLRGERPEEVTVSEASGATFNGFRYRTAHCTYSYAGDTFSDPNRVDIYFESAPDDPDGMKEYWESISVTETVPGIGDAASWYTNDAFDARSSARALLGSDIISVRVSVPKELAEEPFMTKESLVVALGTVVAQQ